MGNRVQLWMDDCGRGAGLSSVELHPRFRQLVYGTLANPECGDKRRYTSQQCTMHRVRQRHHEMSGRTAARLRELMHSHKRRWCQVLAAGMGGPQVGAVGSEKRLAIPDDRKGGLAGLQNEFVQARFVISAHNR